jgi:hypothetical protein
MEFEDLLGGVIKDNSTARELRPGRRPHDVTQLWNAIHTFHAEPESSTLSPMMRQRLAVPRGLVRCAVCQATF